MFKKILTSVVILFGLSTAEAQQQAAKQEMKSTPNDLVQSLHTAFGDHHSRAVHAKGIILQGTFTPAKEAASITKAVHLQKEKSNVTVRFSDFTGIPNIPDNNEAANPRGISIKFMMPGGGTTDIVGHSFNGFPVKNSDEFRDLLLSLGASGPNTPKPTKLDTFLASHPTAKTFLTTQKTPESFATISYFGVNAFKFTNKNGESHFVRYQFVPEDGEHLYTKDQADKAGPDYLMNEIKNRVAKKPFRFKYYAQIADKGDVIDDPSVAWPSSRHRVLLGTIEISKLSANTSAEDRQLSYFPNNVPSGIEPADPMINFRSAAYAISVQERNSGPATLSKSETGKKEATE